MNEAPNRIREIRLAAKLSQEKLGQMIGRKKVTISALETGAMKLTVAYMRKLASAMGVAPSDLLPKADNPAGLSLRERRLIDTLRRASAEQREQIEAIAKVLLKERI